jgi:hypothetical protein
LIPVSAAEAKSPGEIDHDEIGFRFGSGDSMGSLVANDFFLNERGRPFNPKSVAAMLAARAL